MQRKKGFSMNRRGFLAGTAAIGVSITLPRGLLAADGKVNFYNWDTYIGENTITQFEKDLGIEVQYDLYADNDELFAKLKGGNPGYDVIVPTNNYIERMASADMLMPLDHSKIPNIKNIDPSFMDPAFDPGRQFSLPYMWGTIGIGYRKSAVDQVPDSWSYLLSSDQYAGRIALLSEAITVMQMAQKLLGRSINDWSGNNIEEAAQVILKQKPNITAFAPDNGQDLLLSGEVDLAMEWNGDIEQVILIDDDIGYVLPKEGGLLWEDTLAIPVGAPNVENAHALINFLLDAEVGAGIADTIQFATPNMAAKKLMDPAYTENPTIFPGGESLEKSEYATYPGQDITRKIDEAWTRVKSAG